MSPPNFLFICLQSCAALPAPLCFVLIYVRLSHLALQLCIFPETKPFPLEGCSGCLWKTAFVCPRALIISKKPLKCHYFKTCANAAVNRFLLWLHHRLDIKPLNWTTDRRIKTKGNKSVKTSFDENIKGDILCKIIC